MSNACTAQSLQSCLTLCEIWTIARQVPLSLGFSRQEHWSRLPCPPPGDLPEPGIKPVSPALQVDSLSYGPPGMLILSLIEDANPHYIRIASY